MHSSEPAAPEMPPCHRYSLRQFPLFSSSFLHHLIDFHVEYIHTHTRENHINQETEDEKNTVNENDAVVFIIINCFSDFTVKIYG